MVAKKEVAPVPADMFPQELPESVQGSNRGNEEVGGDVARPQLKLLQQMSRELNSAAAEYVDGAKVGQILNTVSGQLYDEVHVANLYYYKNFTVFKKLEEGGGFEGAFATRDEAEAHLAEMNRDQFEVIETAHHICAQIDTATGRVTPVELLMSSTKLPISDRWNSNIRDKSADGGDRFSTVWRISHVMQTRKANTWAQYKVDFAGFAPETLHAACVEAYDGVIASMTRSGAS